MKILLVTQWFDPEPTFKGLMFARELKAQGHEVEVITGFPNYPGGKVYPGYRIKWRQREVIDDILITRVPLYPSHDSSSLRRILNYLSFGVSSCFFGIFFSRRADVIYAYHPPLTVGLAAAVIGFFRRTPLVYDIQDMWPDTLRATGMVTDAKVLSLVSKVCQWVYRRAAGILVLSPGFKRLLIERGVPEGKIEVVYNWCDESALAASGEGRCDGVDFAGRFNVVFAGTMGKAQALDSVLRAAQLVGQKSREVQFVFVGGGIEVEHLKAYSSSLNLKNVCFLPRMAMQDIGRVLSAADVLLVHLRDDPLFAITIPSKTQAYLAVGKPILMAVRGDAADLIAMSASGLVATPEDEGSLDAAIMQLVTMPKEKLNEMGRCGAEFYREQLSVRVGVAKIIRFFQKVVGQ